MRNSSSSLPLNYDATYWHRRLFCGGRSSLLPHHQFCRCKASWRARTSRSFVAFTVIRRLRGLSQSWRSGECRRVDASSANKLAGIGVDFLICPDNTIHQALPYVEPRSPRPWLHIAEVVAAEAATRGYRRLGLVGTRWLVESEVYPEKLSALGLECLRPGAAERIETSRIIMDELVCGVFKPEGIAYYQRCSSG